MKILVLLLTMRSFLHVQFVFQIATLGEKERSAPASESLACICVILFKRN